MDIKYSAEHVFRFTLDEPIKHYDREIDMIRVELQWTYATDDPQDGIERDGWWLNVAISGWPLTAKGTRDMRIKRRESVYAERYPAALKPFVDEALDKALAITGIEPGSIINVGEGILRPDRWATA
jgi:hypothetical protein